MIRRGEAAGLCREALRRLVSKRKGGGRTNPLPPPPLAKLVKYGKRAGVNIRLFVYLFTYHTTLTGNEPT